MKSIIAGKTRLQTAQTVFWLLLAAAAVVYAEHARQVVHGAMGGGGGGRAARIPDDDRVLAFGRQRCPWGMYSLDIQVDEAGMFVLVPSSSGFVS